MYDDIYDQEPLTEEQEFGMTISEMIDKEVERRLEDRLEEIWLLRESNKTMSESLHDFTKVEFIFRPERVFGYFAEGRYAWEKKDVKSIDPVPAKGQQGLWNWEKRDA